MAMDKRTFLFQEYERIRASGQVIWPDWQSNFERFLADLSDMTPKWIGERYLAPRKKELGIVPGNVEWHFKKRPVSKVATSKIPSKSSKKPSLKTPAAKGPRKALSAAEKRGLAQAGREMRLQRLADEFKRWEDARRVGSHIAAIRRQQSSKSVTNNR